MWISQDLRLPLVNMNTLGSLISETVFEVALIFEGNWAKGERTLHNYLLNMLVEEAEDLSLYFS